MINPLKELKFLENIIILSVIGSSAFALIPDKSAKDSSNSPNRKYESVPVYKTEQSSLYTGYLTKADSLEKKFFEKYIR